MGIFLDSLKTGNKTQVYKKDEPTDKENYRPETILHYYQKFLKD